MVRLWSSQISKGEFKKKSGFKMIGCHLASMLNLQLSWSCSKHSTYETSVVVRISFMKCVPVKSLRLLQRHNAEMCCDITLLE